jgi:HME family heavy-metal exporter
VVADIRQAVADTRLPEGYFITLGGQFQAQEEASAWSACCPSSRWC